MLMSDYLVLSLFGPTIYLSARPSREVIGNPVFDRIRVSFSGKRRKTTLFSGWFFSFELATIW
jgi:hypothetical protein